MKKIVVFAFLFCAQFIAAQVDTTPIDADFTNDTLRYNTAGLEVQPDFPGGLESFKNFFNLNFKMPEGEVIKDKIVTMFIIEKDGSLSNIKVIRGGGLATKKEVSRVLKMCPKWKPGTQNGKTVRTFYSTLFPIKNVSLPTRRKK